MCWRAGWCWFLQVLDDLEPFPCWWFLGSFWILKCTFFFLLVRNGEFLWCASLTVLLRCSVLPLLCDSWSWFTLFSFLLIYGHKNNQWVFQSFFKTLKFFSHCIQCFICRCLCVVTLSNYMGSCGALICKCLRVPRGLGSARVSSLGCVTGSFQVVSFSVFTLSLLILSACGNNSSFLSHSSMFLEIGIRMFFLHFCCCLFFLVHSFPSTSFLWLLIKCLYVPTDSAIPVRHSSSQTYQRCQAACLHINLSHFVRCCENLLWICWKIFWYLLLSVSWPTQTCTVTPRSLNCLLM